MSRAFRLPRRSMSLKWKALALTSLVLIAIVIGFTLTIHRDLHKQFDHQQALLHRTRVKALDGVIDNALTTLQRTAALTKNLAGVEPALLAQDSSALRDAFGRFWGELQLDQGLDEAHFYGRDNRILTSFGRTDPLPPEYGSPPLWIEMANKEERPVSALACALDCHLYVAAPLMVRGQRMGAVLFAIPLSDIVLAFKMVTGVDIALIVPRKEGGPETDERAMPRWGMQIQAVTSARRYAPLLRGVEKRHALAELTVGIQSTDGSDYIRLYAVPLHRFAPESAGYWVMISDVTESLAGIGNSIRNNLWFGLFGLLAAELLLAGLLWHPLSRLRATADTLPLLGEGAFERARKIIAARSRRTILFADESDLLDDTAIALSQRLEVLEVKVVSRTRKLRVQANDLRRERDFVQRLLDTAQAVILTQDRNQRILTLNRFGMRLLNLDDPEELHGRTFSDLLISTDNATEIPGVLAQLAEGRRDRFQHDSNVRGGDGQLHDISWRHSRVDVGAGETAVLSIGLDVSEQREAERRIVWLADHDPLTGLFNRRRFQEELQRAIAEVARYDQCGGLLYLDVDQFKYINDASGHQTGDMLLMAIARTLQNTVRTTDIVGRLGGDEFAVLMSHTDTAGSIKLANKIQSALTILQVEAGERMQRISVSIGIALFPAHGVDVQDLLAVADLAMYQAKDSGRGRWQLYSPQDQGREFVKTELETKALVERAVSEHRLIFHYQPILDVKRNTISHFEALLRLVKPDGGLLYPDGFIEVSERTGLIRVIDNYVLQLAAREIETFVRDGHDVRLSVNLSAFAFDDPELPSTLEALFSEYPGVKERLVFEITETAAVTDFVATCGVVQTLRDKGCAVAVDDFGTGFSSLKYLKQLPVDYIKIDGLFIRDLVDKLDDQILVRAVIEVARVFGKKSVAEFVERADVFDWLRSQGVDYVQGYLIGRAMPRSEISAFLAESGKFRLGPTTGEQDAPIVN